MSDNFRIEPVEGTELIKIFKRTSENLPLPINCDTRFNTFSSLLEKYLEEIYDFEIRIDDIWVITQPKSGTTWMLELVWLLQNECDFKTALEVDQEDRIPFLEFCSVISEEAPNSIDRATNMPSPRIIKSHLPIHLLPKKLWTIKPKIIYVTRDCKDTMVSYYHFHSILGFFKGTLDEYVKSMMKNKIRSSPLGINSLEFWQLRNMTNVFFTSFERMKKDLRLVISKVSEFLQKDVNEDQMVKLLDHLSFGKMKDNSRCNHINETRKIQKYFGFETNQNSSRFVRKGEINSYKTELSEEVKKELENWNNKQMEAYGVTADEMLWS